MPHASPIREASAGWVTTEHGRRPIRTGDRASGTGDKMMKVSKLALLTSLLLLLGASRALALDMCFQDDFASILVGQSFRFPGPGRCKSFNGYQNGNGSGCLISGEACGTSDNGRVKFNLTWSCTTGGAFGTYWFAIDRANADLPQAGLGNACQPNTSNGTWTCTQFHLNEVPCPVPHPLSTFP
jgi:hypothetical protein